MILGISGYVFLLLGLASFRLTRLIVFDKITAFIRAPFLEEVIDKDEEGNEVMYIVPKNNGIRKWIGELISCYWCTGIWVSTLLLCVYWFTPNVGEPLILILAVAAIGSIIETIISLFISH